MKKRVIAVLLGVCLFTAVVDAQVVVRVGADALVSSQGWLQQDYYSDPPSYAQFDVFGASAALSLLVTYGKNLVIFANEVYGIPLYVLVNNIPFDLSRAMMRISMDTIIGIGANVISTDNFTCMLGAGVHNYMLVAMSLDYTSTLPALPFGITLGAGAVFLMDFRTDEKTSFYLKASAAYDFLSFYGISSCTGGPVGAIGAGIGLHLF